MSFIFVDYSKDLTVEKIEDSYHITRNKPDGSFMFLTMSSDAELCNYHMRQLYGERFDISRYDEVELDAIEMFAKFKLKYEEKENMKQEETPFEREKKLIDAIKRKREILNKDKFDPKKESDFIVDLIKANDELQKHNPDGMTQPTPTHYHYEKHEPIDVIQEWELNFNLGNVIKYIARHKRRGTPIEDLRKAKNYLDHELAIATQLTERKQKFDLDEKIKAHELKIKEHCCKDNCHCDR